jgi:predicted TIM-barrel fold metal-dependent hydrolase
LAGKRPEEFSLNVRKLDERSGASDPIERIKDMDLDGVDAGILFFGGPLVTKDRALYINSVRGYHRWLSDFCSHAPDRLLGMASVPIETPELAVEELRFAKLAGLVGGSIPLFPTEGEYADSKWDPMWEAFLETGLPVALHTGGRRPGTPAVDLFESAPRFMTGLVMNKMTMAEAISELIFGLVMQRYPDLKFVAVEA